MPDGPLQHGDTPVSRALLMSTATGALAMAMVGVLDALLAGGNAAQFVEGAARLRFLLYVGLSHGLVGAFAGFVIQAFASALWRGTRLGRLAAAAGRLHAAARLRDSRSILGVHAIVIAFAPSLALTGIAAYSAVMPFVSGRHALNLVVVVVMVITLAAVVAAIPLALLFGRALELALCRLDRRDRSPTVVTSPWMPFVVVVGTGLLVTTSYIVWNWTSLEVRAFRGAFVFGTGVLLLVVPAHWFTKRVLLRLPSSTRIARAAVAIALVGSTTALILWSGRSEQVIKASSAYTQVGARITALLRKPFDWDRDGFARVLGGGDCDDGDASIHPGAVDTPADGIDQNCLGSDAATDVSSPSYEFAELPAGVPADANLLLITIDTVRADHLGAYGYPRTTSPSLDRLGSEGIVFTNGWSHAPSTYYAMPAILTGRLPLSVRTGPQLEGSATISSDAVTLAERLQSLGFSTGALTNLPYFAPGRGLEQGFEFFDNSNAKLHARAGLGDARGTSAREQTTAAAAFIERNAGRRWFLWVHYLEPHYRYERHPETPFGDSAIDLYDGEIAFADRWIGSLLSMLRERGLDGKTIVAVTSDHGESFGEHGTDFHATHLYTQQTRVPFLLRIPGLSPRRITTPIGHIDLFATLLNLVGAKRHQDVMGRSLVSILREPSSPDPDHIVFQQLSAKRARQVRAVATRECHVLYQRIPDVSLEVYRLDQDPAETRDVSSDPSACSDARAALVRWCDRGCD